MNPQRSIFWHYLILIAAGSLVFVFGDFSNVPPGPRWLLSILFSLLIFNPFLLTWFLAVRRASRQPPPPTGPAEAAAAEIKGLNQKLEAKTRELEAKDVALVMSERRLSELGRAKSDFVSVATHQLRTPLSAIKWTFHMLLKGELGPTTVEQKNFLERGYESTGRVIGIVNNLLDLDYLTREQETYKFVPADLPELINNIIFELRQRAEDKGVALTFASSETNLPAVEIDPVRVSVAIENLIENALRYTKTGGRVNVSLSGARLNSTPPMVEVQVDDTGIGIPEGEQPKVFERFFRSSNAVRAVPDGSGLGLSIAKDIVNRHHGQIWFDSREGVGTTFHLSIPVHQGKV